MMHLNYINIETKYIKIKQKFYLDFDIYRREGGA